MVLYEHPVNVAREQRGEAPVNSLWIWGGGTAPMVQKRYDKMRVDDPLLRALAALSDTPPMEPPGGAMDFPVDDHDLAEFVVTADPDTARSMSALETDWLVPAWRALAAGRLDVLTLVLALPNAVVVCRCDRKGRRRFWRRKQSLARLLDQWLARS